MERWQDVVAELERWYVGPGVPVPRREIVEVGEWRDILNEAAKRIAALKSERDALKAQVERLLGGGA